MKLVYVNTWAFLHSRVILEIFFFFCRNVRREHLLWKVCKLWQHVYWGRGVLCVCSCVPRHAWGSSRIKYAQIHLWWLAHRIPVIYFSLSESFTEQPALILFLRRTRLFIPHISREVRDLPKCILLSIRNCATCQNAYLSPSVIRHTHVGTNFSEQ